MKSKTNDLLPLTRPIARRVNFAVWMNRSIPGALVAMGVYATALIALKLFYSPAAPYSLTLLPLAPLMLVWGYAQSRRHGLFFRPAEIIEVIDHLYKNDGSICAYHEAPKLKTVGADAQFYSSVVGEVSERLPKIDARHYLRRILPVALYVLLAILAPSIQPAAQKASQAIVATLSKPLLEKLEEYQEILPEEEIAELNEELDKINKSPLGISKEQWEAIEELEKRIDDAAERGRNQMSQLASQLTDISNQMNAAGSGSAESTPDLQDVQDALQDLQTAMNNPKTSLSGKLRKDMSGKLGKMNGMSPEALAKMLGDMRKELSKLPGGT